MEIDGMKDDYDYYESQAARQNRMKQRTKSFGKLPFHPSMSQRTRKHGCPQFREKVGDVLATLVGYQNREFKRIYSVSEQDLDDNVATTDNVVVYENKKNAIYSVDGYTTAVGFGDPGHQHKRNWKKQYNTDVNINGCKTRKDDARFRLCLRLRHRFRHFQSYNHQTNSLDKTIIIDVKGGLYYINANTQLHAIIRIISGTSIIVIDVNVELYYINASTQLPVYHLNNHLNYNLNKAKLTMLAKLTMFAKLTKCGWIIN
ncbi:MAG: hypothetical protein EZS28_001450 [Streblomastix strix]|uniref:Uncharacterized protein n=1 Tax=Streblomastix strix TaxID=222440 RepID=A0A5J4X841_9EUKA|nr:MAG: hypothetical protein EZS28_001450 [Streblomastix strix]